MSGGLHTYYGPRECVDQGACTTAWAVGTRDLGGQGVELRGIAVLPGCLAGLRGAGAAACQRTGNAGHPLLARRRYGLRMYMRRGGLFSFEGEECSVEGQ